MTLFSATYSPEDNKLRLYASQRLDKDDYLEIKNAGFRWAPKQELFVAPMWTPEREDTLLGFVDEIGDEDYSPEERAADRAERFSGYRYKRRGEAGDHADTFESGPSAFGHQNRQRAERQAANHDRHRTQAVSQWSKAEYWQDRTAGVIRHALHKSSASVRRGRILTLEADQRKMLKNLNESVLKWETWKCIAAEPDAELATKAALSWCGGTRSMGYNYQHPRLPDKPTTSLWSLMNYEPDPITGHEAAALALDGEHEDGPSHVDGWYSRWVMHYELRLSYDRAMLAEEGGSAGDADMEPGGFVGKHQIQRVYRSPVTKAVVSVDVLGLSPNNYDRDGKAYDETNARPIVMRKINIQKLGKNIYRAPTHEERVAFKESTESRKAEEKTAKGKPIKLINPTDDDAEKLQAIWNDRADAIHAKQPRGTKLVRQTVRRMTQAQFSDASKGDYAQTSTVSERLRIRDQLGKDIFKVRTCSGTGNGFSMYAADRVIVLTDKPQSPIPWQDVADAVAKRPTAKDLYPKLGRLYDLSYSQWNRDWTDEEQKLIADAVYLGWWVSSSSTQFRLTDEGQVACQEWRDNQVKPATKQELLFV